MSSRPSAGSGGAAPLGFWQRFKLLFAGLAVALIAVAVLVLALVVGSLLAAVLWIFLTIVVVAAVLKVTLRQAR